LRIWTDRQEGFKANACIKKIYSTKCFIDDLRY
jgi:hypothetical protein